MAIYTASTDAELLEYTATNRGQKTRWNIDFRFHYQPYNIQRPRIIWILSRLCVLHEFIPKRMNSHSNKTQVLNFTM